MATRTIKLMGKAYSTDGDVSIVVNFNNTEVFNGTVTTVASEAPLKVEESVELASWTIDTSVTGSIPLSITSSGGTFQFNNLVGNYAGYELQTEDDPDAPGYTRFVKVDGVPVVVTQPEDYVGELNFNTEASDGKDNVTWTNWPEEGDAPQRVIEESEDVGDWFYRIPDSATFSCDFVIDPTLTITEIPAV